MTHISGYNFYLIIPGITIKYITNTSSSNFFDSVFVSSKPCNTKNCKKFVKHFFAWYHKWTFSRFGVDVFSTEILQSLHFFLGKLYEIESGVIDRFGKFGFSQ